MGVGAEAFIPESAEHCSGSGSGSELVDPQPQPNVSAVLNIEPAAAIRSSDYSNQDIMAFLIKFQDASMVRIQQLCDKICYLIRDVVRSDLHAWKQR